MSDIDSTTRATWVRWRILAVLLAFSFMSWFNRVSMPVAYDEQIKSQFGISETKIGFVYSALLIAYMLCMTPGGWFVDRYGPWLALVLMGFGSALFVALTGVAGYLALSTSCVFIWWLIVRAAMGACTAPIYPASGRIIAHWLPSGQRALTNGMITAAALLGIAGTYYGFGFLLDKFRWPMAFVITGAITALLAILWTWYGRNDPSEHPEVNQAELQNIRAGDAAPVPAPPGPMSWADWRLLLRNRSLVLITLSYAAVGYFEYLFFFWMHYYFDDVLQLGKDVSRRYSTILFLSMAAGMFLGGLLADFLSQVWGRRRGRACVVLVGMLAGAGLLGLAILAQQPVWIVTWLALAVAAVGATEGPFWATAIDLGGPRGGTSAGIFNTGGNAGGAVAPELTPLVSKYFGWQWGIGLGSLVCLAGVVLWYWIDPEERVPEPTQEDSRG